MAKKMILTAITVICFLTLTTITVADNRRQPGRQNQHKPQPQVQQQHKPKPQTQHHQEIRPAGQHHQNYYYSNRPLLFPVRYERAIPNTGARTVSIWITNNNGVQTEVMFKAVNYGGYLGPRGEYYTSIPTYDRIRTVYGAQTTVLERASVVFYLNNVRGGETVVVLTKRGTNYYGPRGEYYQCLPTIAQLRLVYGR